MKSKMNIVPIFAIIAALLIAGCTGYNGAQKEQTTTTTPAAEVPEQEGATATQNEQQQEPQEKTAPAETAKAKEFTVESSEFKFSPATLSVKKGDKVKITFKNTGAAPHNFIIDELGVSTQVLGTGQSEVVEFTADKTGAFAFYCSVDSHRAKGMEGTATVA